MYGLCCPNHGYPKALRLSPLTCIVCQVWSPLVETQRRRKGRRRRTLSTPCWTGLAVPSSITSCKIVSMTMEVTGESASWR